MATTVQNPTGMELDYAGLASSVRGQIIDPGSPAYDEARRTYNAMIDRYPALIVRAADDSDVISTVRFAKERNLDLSVRGGAHNVAGFGTNDGGVVLDLSLMRNIRVDPKNRTARASGGATWGDLDHALHQERAADRDLQQVPSILHGQAEARRLGRPRGTLPQALREEDIRRFGVADLPRG